MHHNRQPSRKETPVQDVNAGNTLDTLEIVGRLPMLEQYFKTVVKSLNLGHLSANAKFDTVIDGILRQGNGKLIRNDAVDGV